MTGLRFPGQFEIDLALESVDLGDLDLEPVPELDHPHIGDEGGITLRS
jgi:hypothetical protein